MIMPGPKFKNQPEFDFGKTPEPIPAPEIPKQIPEKENITEGNLFDENLQEVGKNQSIATAKIELYKQLHEKYPLLVAGAFIEDLHGKSHIVIITIKDPKEKEKLDILSKYKGYDVVIKVDSTWPLL